MTKMSAAVTVTLQKVKRHTLGGFGAYAGQTAQTLYELFQQPGVLHG